MLRRCLVIWCWCVGLLVGWGLCEAAYLFMVRYHVHAAHDPRAGLNLFLAALFNHAIIGAGAGLLLAPLFAIATRLRRDLQPASFLVAGTAGFLFFGESVSWIWTRFLRGLPLSSPKVMGAGVLAVGLSVMLAITVHRLISMERLGPARRWTRQALPWVAMGVCLTFVTLGLFLGQERVRAQEPVAGRTMSPAVSGVDQPPDVFLLTIETTRADRLGAWSRGDAASTPTIERLSSQGVTFRRAYASAPWTVPSMASLITGRHPEEHGMEREGTGLASGVDTLPRVLARNGYRTVSFYNNAYAWSPTFGFDDSSKGRLPGDRYWVSPVDPRPFIIGRWHHKLMTLALRLTFPRHTVFYRDAAQLNEAAFRWLAQRPSGPLFMHMHYVDPHEPYLEHPYRHVQFDPRVRANGHKLLQRYDGEIEFVDRAIERFLGELRARDLLENAIVIVTSDHGEEFLDHGGWGHRNSLYLEQLHVPLIFVAPGRLPAGRVVDAPVSLVDVAATVVDLAELSPSPGFTGASLQPLVAGGTPRPVLSQLLAGSSRLDSLVDGDWHLIRARSGGTTRLFNMAHDGGEQVNLAADRPGVTAELEARLNAILEASARRRRVGAPVPVSPKERRQLESLGYVE